MAEPRWNWKQPPGAEPDGSAAQLQLYSSYHNHVVPFVPAAGPHSRHISWYTCGPTVYEVSHMGHARNYLTSDVIRRVLEDYFGYTIRFVMNVTDVDDKIILKARRAFRLQRYMDSAPQAQQARDLASKAMQTSLEQKLQEAQCLSEEMNAAEANTQQQTSDSRAAKAAEERRSRLELAQKRIQEMRAQHRELQERHSGSDAATLAGAFGEVLAEELDRGDSHGDVDITDHAVFQQHARRYEAEFLRDMDDLGVRRPTAMPRVSEHIPEIVDYIVKIVEKGLGYVASGSVYFDTVAFEASGHQYRKLSPAVTNTPDANAADGEADFATSDKRNARDFALWKASKPGEPTWESPWGRGRPGWHIECSAMASALIGGKVDIHTGGVDLRFPHHDNEIAQAEAFYHGDEGSGCDCHQWVNYFLHLGHLHIEGLKMSKSLKNFITIREALAIFSARQLRLMMCLQPWNNGMTFGEQTKEETVAKERELRNFFGNVVTALRETKEAVQRRGPLGSSTRWQAGERKLSQQLEATQEAVHATHLTLGKTLQTFGAIAEERELSQQLEVAQEATHAALCANVNTAAALGHLSDLMSAVNKYLTKRPLHGSQPDGLLPQADLVRSVAAYVLRIVSAFGLVDGPSDNLASFNVSGDSGSVNDADVPFISAFLSFRDEVRSAVRSKAPPEESLRALLAACDRARDETFAELGVRLDDRPGAPATWQREDPAVLAAERRDAAAAKAQAELAKLEKKLASRKQELERLETQARMGSIQEEKAIKEKYSPAGWSDQEGAPSTAADGLPLSDKDKKAAQKAVDKERKKRTALFKAQKEEGSEWREGRQAEIEELMRTLQVSQAPTTNGIA